MVIFALAACTPIETGFQKPDTDETVDTGDTSGDTDTEDTADTDGDLDDDGFTPDEGDCDDASIYVSPAREEDTSDGLDNDCDGRTDEEWSGFDIGRVDDNGAGSIITLDTIGRVDDTVNLSSACTPNWLDHLGDGWVVSNAYAEVDTVDGSGACSLLADFSDPEVYEYGVWGIATNVDGTVLAATVGALHGIDASGVVTDLATWVVDFEDPDAHQLAATNVAVDLASGEVGLFDYFGGFATWTAEGGLMVHVKGDYLAPTLYTTSGAHRDGGGWYTQGIDATTGAYAIYRFDLDARDWVLEEAWDTDADWSPEQVAIDGDSGDWYVTANVSGIFPSVYRIVEGWGYADDFYRIKTDYAGYFYGITTDYTYGE